MNLLKPGRTGVASALGVLAFGLACAAAPAFAINYDGSLDPSLSPVFDTPFAGIPGLFRYSVDLGGGGSDHNADSATAVAVQVDGKIVVAGFSFNNYLGTDQNACVIQRFNADGSIDYGFGASGQVVQNFNPSGGRNDCFLTSVALQGDGKIVVAGNIADVSHGERALIERFNANGSSDHSFASTGYFVVPNNKTAFAAVKVNPAGPIYAAGRGSGFYGSSHTDNDFYLAVFSATGTLTQELTTFFDLGADKDDRANAMVVEPNFGLAKVYLVGNANSAPYSDQPHHQCAIAAYVYSLNDSAFVTDTTFRGDGAASFDILAYNEGDTYCRAALARKGGGVVVGGESYFISTLTLPAGRASHYALGEIDRNGSVLYSSAQGNFFQMFALPGIYNGIFGMAREAGGKVIVTGYAGTDDANGLPSDGVAMRLLSNFVTDPSFGTDPSHHITLLSLDGLGGLDPAQREWGTAMAMDNHGRIVVVGERSYQLSNTPGDYDWLISRLNMSDVIFRDGLDGVVPD